MSCVLARPERRGGRDDAFLLALARAHLARCDAGDAMSCGEFAYVREVFFSGAPDVPEEVLVARHRVACDAGRAASCYSLAHRHERGKAVPRDERAAERLYRQACQVSLGADAGCYDAVRLARHAARAPQSAPTPGSPVAPPAGGLVFKYWDPGYLPGWFGRTIAALEETGPHARLTITLERPADGRRKNQNPATWTRDPSVLLRLDGRVQARPDGTTYWFERAAPRPVALVCRRATVPVHVAGATVEPPACSPCYEDCPGSGPKWTPAITRPRAVLDCVLRAADDVGHDGVEKPGDEPPVPDLAGIGRARIAPSDSMNRAVNGHLFFAPPPGVEHLVGKTDCPPQGLRDAR